jgi:DNA-directed RNA polymerase subunit F
MIKDRNAVAMYQVKEILASTKESDKSKAVNQFIEKFMKADEAKSKKLKEAIEALGIIRLRPADVIKIVDVLPENIIELNKIFGETSLETDEATKILDTIKNNK